MEKDVDEVGKIARNVKLKVEAINKDVTFSDLQTLNICCIFCMLMSSLYKLVSFRTWPIEKSQVAEKELLLIGQG